MSNLTVTGFPSGSVAVELRRASDSGLIASVAGTVFRDDARWQPSPDFSGASVYASRRGTDDPGDTRIYTGEGVVFGVEGMNAHAIMFCDYEWNFGGDAYEFDTLAGSGLWATNAGTAEGPYVGHTFRTAGTFTVTVNVYDHTRTLAWSDSIQITVLPASDLPTIYLAPLAVSPGAARFEAFTQFGIDEPEESFRVGSFETALTEASGNVAKTRLLIKAGSEIDIDRTIYRDLDNIHVDTYGTGGKVLLTQTYQYEVEPPAEENAGRRVLRVTGPGVTLRNFHVKGSYNSITPPRYAPWLFGSYGILHDSAAPDGRDHFTVDSCFFEGFEICFSTAIGEDRLWVLSNTTFNHWFAEAVYCAQTIRAVTCGCRLEQVAGTIEHPRKTGLDADPVRATTLDDNNAHWDDPTATVNNWYATAAGGAVRLANYVTQVGFHQCHVICRSGWSDIGGEWSNEVGPVDYRGQRKTAIQPAFRIISNSADAVTESVAQSYSFWQVHAMGGTPFVDYASNVGTAYTDSALGGLGFVYSQCIAEGGWETQHCWRLMYGNTALRSCLGIIKDRVEWAGAEERLPLNRPVSAIEVVVDPDDGTPERNHDDVKAPIWALGCTFANELPPRQEFYGWSGSVRPLHHRGCLALTVDVPAAKIIRGEPDQPTGMVTTGAVLASTVATVPGAGASVLGDGFEFAPRRDIAGNLRPADAAAGAYEGQS